MQLDLKSTKPPVLDIVPGSANFTLTGTMDANVVQPDNTIVNAFVLGLVCTCTNIATCYYAII